jgi:3-methyladenine DNA glycosylase/8-oxoguanine DNA glycosylase
LPRIRIALPDAFSFDRVVRSHGWYDLPPFAYDRGRRELRTFVALRGKAVRLLFHEEGGALEVSASRLSRRALEKIAVRAFSLDLDEEAASRALSGHPELARALAGGGGRMLRAPAVFEDAVKMLLTTNCSWAATRGMVERLIALAGAEGRAFPRPEDLASFRPATLRERIRCGYRAEPLSRLARRVASGTLDLARWERSDIPSEAIREEILAESGFGPYAAEGLLRILGRHDFLALDSWVRQKYRKLYPGPAKATDRSIARRYRAFGRFQGLALWLDLTRDWHRRDEEPAWP